MRRVKFKKNNLIMLACLLVFSLAGFAGWKVNAASAIEQDNSKISLNFSESDASMVDSIKEYDADYGKDNVITVNLYQIGEIDKTGKYTSDYIDIEKYTSGDLKAADVTDMVANAKSAVTEAVESGSFKGEKYSFNLLETDSVDVKNGLYLISIDETEDARYVYDFEDIIVSAPSNDWYQYDANGNLLEQTDDEWNYNPTGYVKPQKTQKYGSVVINKTLDSFNATLGPISFVYEVTAELDGETVFDNVYAIDFTGTGSDSITVPATDAADKDKIPAGATVTVKEVYCSASYQAVSGVTEVSGLTVIADSDVNDSHEAATANFENKYTGVLDVTALAVTNQFTSTTDDDGVNYTYTWTKIDNQTKKTTDGGAD